MSPAQDDRGVNRRLNLPKFSPPLISLLAASSHSPTCARCEPQFNHCCRAWALGAAGTPLERLRGGFLGSQRAPTEPCPSAGACCSLILPQPCAFGSVCLLQHSPRVPRSFQGWLPGAGEGAPLPLGSALQGARAAPSPFSGGKLLLSLTSSSLGSFSLIGKGKGTPARSVIEP